MNKLQAKPLLRGFLPLQGTNQLVPQLGQVLLIHLQTDTGESHGQTGALQIVAGLFVGVT